MILTMIGLQLGIKMNDDLKKLLEKIDKMNETANILKGELAELKWIVLEVINGRKDDNESGSY